MTGQIIATNAKKQFDGILTNLDLGKADINDGFTMLDLARNTWMAVLDNQKRMSIKERDYVKREIRSAYLDTRELIADMWCK